MLEQLCKDVQAQAVLYQESIRNASELEDTTGVELYPTAAGGKARPMVVIKQVGQVGCVGAAWNLRVPHAAHRTCKKLCSYKRLVPRATLSIGCMCPCFAVIHRRR